MSNKFREFNNIIIQGPVSISDAALNGGKEAKGSGGDTKVNTLMKECFDAVVSGRDLIIKACGDEKAAKVLIYTVLNGYLAFYWGIFANRAKRLCKEVERDFKSNSLSKLSDDELKDNNKASELVAKGVKSIGSLISYGENQVRSTSLKDFQYYFQEFERAFGSKHWSETYFKSIQDACSALEESVRASATEKGIDILSARTQELHDVFFLSMMDPIFTAIENYGTNIDDFLKHNAKGNLYLKPDEIITDGDKTLSGEGKTNEILYTSSGSELRTVFSNLFSDEPLDKELYSEEFTVEFEKARESLKDLMADMSSKWSAKGEKKTGETSDEASHPENKPKEGDETPGKGSPEKNPEE